jgi:hypothetical protein
MSAPTLEEMINAPIMLTSRAERETRGNAALERLLPIAARDHGQAVRVQRFLLGLYNGSNFPFDLNELRGLDLALMEDCLAVLAMDMDGPAVEIHRRPGAGIVARWAEDVWPNAGAGIDDACERHSNGKITRRECYYCRLGDG